jgi:hypothetical protein
MREYGAAELEGDLAAQLLLAKESFNILTHGGHNNCNPSSRITNPPNPAHGTIAMFGFRSG